MEKIYSKKGLLTEKQQEVKIKALLKSKKFKSLLSFQEEARDMLFPTLVKTKLINKIYLSK